MKMSAYKLGWIGIRVIRVGKAAKILKNDGWMKMSSGAEVNNRNAFNWMKPVVSREKFETMDWTKLANAGLEALAVWITDAQWGESAAITDHQWADRRVIELDFNAKWPTGRRDAKSELPVR